jgi:hypothetical protein
MASIKDVEKKLNDTVGRLADEFWKPFGKRVYRDANSFKKDLVNEAQEFLRKSRDDVERWAGLMNEEKLTPEEFESLVKGKKDLAEMEALKRAGMALVRIDRLRESLIEVVIKTAFGIFLPD